MQPIKCLTYVLCLATVLATTSPAQLNRAGEATRQSRSALQRPVNDFAAWAAQHAARPGALRSATTIEEGLALAKARRAALRQLIDFDPALAVAAAMNRNTRKALPPQIQNELETQVSGTGDLLVVCAMPAQGVREGGGIHWFV